MPRLAKSKSKSSRRKAPTKKSPKRSASPKRPTPSGLNKTAESHLREFCDATSLQLSKTIGVIVGELDYSMSAPNPRVRERAMMVSLAAAERALGLARNLRYYALNTKLKPELCDLSQIMIDAVDLVEREFEAKSINITVFAEAASFADVDPSAMQQIVLNLLSNAAEAMPSGGTITLILKQHENEVEIRVKDSGMGIPESKLDEVFEPYVSLGPNNTREGAHGLGLAVAKALIEAQKGRIEVFSELNQGSSFVLFLPTQNKPKEMPPFRVKRNYRRIHTRLRADLILKDGTQIKTEICVLSLGGCFIRIEDQDKNELPAVDDSIGVRVHYFQDEFLEIPHCRVASVCWVDPKPGIGIEFLKLNDKAKRLMTAIIQGHAE